MIHSAVGQKPMNETGSFYQRIERRTVFVIKLVANKSCQQNIARRRQQNQNSLEKNCKRYEETNLEQSTNQQKK
jgi:hypothetical protein